MKSVILVLLVIGASGVGLRIVDPLSPDTTSPSVELTDSPAEIAHATMKQTEYRNYEVSYYQGRTSNASRLHPDVTLEYRVRYENTDEQAAWIAARNDSRVFGFENPYFRWSRAMRDGTVVVEREKNLHDVDGRFYMEEGVLDCECVRVHHQNESILVLRINAIELVTEFRYGPDVDSQPVRSAVLDLYIDKSDRRLRKAAYQFEFNGTDGQYVVHRVEVYQKWNDVEVDRPRWAGYTIEEFYHDLLNIERRRALLVIPPLSSSPGVDRLYLEERRGEF